MEIGTSKVLFMIKVIERVRLRSSTGSSFEKVSRSAS